MTNAEVAGFHQPISQALTLSIVNAIGCIPKRWFVLIWCKADAPMYTYMSLTDL